MAHGWAGNVRELENVLQRAILMHDGERIEAGDLAIETVIAAPAFRMAAVDTPAPVFHDSSPIRLADAKRQSLARAIEEALAATGGHRLRAAERLGISERTLRYRMADLRAVA